MTHGWNGARSHDRLIPPSKTRRTVIWSHTARSLSAIKANETRGPEGRRAAARKAVATRKGIPFEG